MQLLRLIRLMITACITTLTALISEKKFLNSEKSNAQVKKVFAKNFKKDTDLSFTENEAVTIIKYALDNPDYHNLAIATLITTGLRAGELLALKPSDVQIEFGRLIVDKMEVTKSYEIVDRCKDEIRSPHDCRRTYASIQYLHGVDVKTLQAQLGHASAAQTWDYIKDIVDNSTRLEKIEKGCIFT